MKKTLVAALLLLIALAALSCASSTAPVVATPEPASKSDMAMNCVDFPYEEDVWNPCCEETVHATGTRHICMANRLDEKGQAIIHMNFSDLTLTGPSGTSHGNTVVHESIRYNFIDEGEVTFKQGSATFREHVTNQSGCGYTFVDQSHVVMDGAGKIHFLRDTVFIECQ